MADQTLQKQEVELVKLLYQQLSLALWAESLAAICLTIALWGAIEPILLISWLAFNLLFCGLARHLLVYFYKRSPNKNNYPDAHKWLIAFAVGAFVSGISWGMSGSLLMVPGDMVRQVFCVFLLLGVTAAANPLYSPNRIVYAVFLFLAFLPFTFWLFLQEGPMVLLGVMSLFYMAIMMATSFYSYTLISNALVLRFKNADLVANLSKAKNTLEMRTRELEKSLAKLFHQAHFDSLTGLPNRLLLLDRTFNAITFVKEKKVHLAVLFIDLDRFKLINDSLGHTFADKLLQEVGKRLESCITPYDTVSREGGDEFVIVINSLHNEPEIIDIANNILNTLREPFLIDGHKLNMTASIGISLYPKDGLDPEMLVRNADMAMYHAKESGRNNYQFFSDEINKKIINRLVMENQLRDALDHDEFSLVYQPIINLKTGRIVTLEALLRWNRPEFSHIDPEDFILLAEETGIIVKIGDWVVRRACLDAKEWQKQGFSGFRVAVNISSRQFKQENFLENMKNILLQTGLEPYSLALEITESTVMENVENTIKALSNLKKLGVSIIVDDFGTGYSSLNYLKQLPVDKLKIDKTFINDVPIHADDSAITAAIIALAATLNLKVIAEGVETVGQLEFLLSHNCDEVQGFYFSEPLEAEQCITLLEKNKREPYLIKTQSV